MTSWMLGRKQLGSATEQGECSDLCGIRTLSLRPSKGRESSHRLQGGRAKSLTWRLSVKGSEDRRTDLQSEQLPSPDSGGQCWRVGHQPSSQAPVKLPSEMQLTGDSFSHSLATHANTPQNIHQVTTLILAAQNTPGPRLSRTARGQSLKSQCSWLQHRMWRLLPISPT